MKNLKQIEDGIKANGLTGREFVTELQSQCLTFGRELIADMVVETECAEPDFTNMLIFLAHFTDIFMTAERHKFGSGFAEDMQGEVFAITDKRNDSYLEWRRTLFGDEDRTTKNDTPVVESGIETGFDYPTKETAEYNERENQTLGEISRQLEMAFQSDETGEGVKACLKTIIYEASNEAGLPLSDMTLIRAAFPNIIKALPKDYGRGIYHSIHSILRFDTTAFQEFYDQRLDEQPTLRKLAEQIADVMHNPLLPARIYNALGDEIIHIEDAHTPEIILENLKKLSAEE